MARFSGSNDQSDTEFYDIDLRRARFVACDLTGVVVRGVEIKDAEIESPWLFEGGRTLTVNGVDVVPLVDAELNRRFPGRGVREAADPAGLRRAWDAVEHAWGGAVDRARAMPAGAVDVKIAGEWSFAQTLRHLVFATDVWLLGAVLGIDSPYHPVGQPDAWAERVIDPATFVAAPTFDDVLAARQSRFAAMREFLEGVTTADLAVERVNPWAPEHAETTLSCVHTVLGEEWEHLRYAVRDLDVIESPGGAG